MSNYAQQVIAEELPGGLNLPDGVKSHDLKSMNAPFASGSNPPDAMVVIPCTMGTMGRIAHGYSEDVLLRAADVTLKEKRKLILVPRETPLSLVHVKNMELLLLAGATILPANPSFYSGAKTVVATVPTPSSRACWIISAFRTNSRRAGRKKRNEFAAETQRLQSSRNVLLHLCLCGYLKNVFRNSKMGFVRAFFAHGFCAAVRAGGDAGGRARQSRLAGLENLRIDSRGDGLRANLRDGVQPHR